MGALATGAWPVTRQWDAAAEQNFSRFVRQLGQARARGDCGTLTSCLASPAANLYFSDEDRTRKLFADCADLPHILRAYFAYKNSLPYVFVWNVEPIAPPTSSIPNPPVRPAGTRSQLGYSSFDALVSGVVNTVYTKMFRMAPETEGNDTFPVEPTRAGIRPGSVYHDPNGHLLVVYDVTPDGRVLAIDGHPDNSLTHQTLGNQYALGKAGYGGGFRDWRPYTLEPAETAGGEPRVNWTRNADLKTFDGISQYKGSFDVRGEKVGLWAYLRSVLTQPGIRMDPLAEFDRAVGDVCQAAKDRMLAVNAALDLRLHLLPHPGLPDNLYNTDGDWEAYSTPGRDIRFRKQFLDLRVEAERLVREFHRQPSLFAYEGKTSDLVQSLSYRWSVLGKGKECSISYADSKGNNRTLELAALNRRLVTLSFDPYHCPEWRWGAPGIADGEAALCPPDPVKADLYQSVERHRWATVRDTNSGQPVLPDAPPQMLVGQKLSQLEAEFPSAKPTPTPTPTPKPTPIDPIEETLAFGAPGIDVSFSVRKSRVYLADEWIHLRGSMTKPRQTFFKRSVNITSGGIPVNKALVNLLTVQFHSMFKLPVGDSQVLVIQVKDDNDNSVLAQTEIQVSVKPY